MESSSNVLRSCAVVAVFVAATVPNEKAAVPTGGLIGSVYDSVAMRPLAAATVHVLLPGQEPSITTSDAQGTFRFEQLTPGRHLISFSHPSLDSLGLEAQPRAINVTDDEIRVALATPSPRTISHLLCPATKDMPAVGTLIGFVRSAADGAPLGESTVWVRFDDYVVSRRYVQRDTMGRMAHTHGNGYFVVCGIPTGVTVVARAASGADTSGYVEMEVKGDGLLKRDFHVGRMYRTTAPIDGSTQLPAGRTQRLSVQVLRGNGHVSGAIRRYDGRPIQGARISLWGTAREAVTTESGTFTLDSLPTGSHMVDVRALGFVPLREGVEVREGAPTTAQFVLTEKQMFLDTVRVLATRAYVGGRLAEFEGRRRSRIGGYFLNSEEIEARRAASFSDLMRGIPSVQIDPDPRRGDQVRMLGASNENDPYCDPTFWIDGSRQPRRDESLNAIVFPERVVALEVYPRTLEVPAQYQSGSRCGVILIWTGERVRRQIAPEKPPK
ncbi:MAG: carboxypeptidase regulatory-like domain-containing protein [Gemmatimonadota bacterium]